MSRTTTNGFYLENTNNGALVINTINDLTLGELAEGYKDNSENEEGGVSGWNGKLEIRPKFQRAFVVDGDTEWQSALIHSVLNERPTGVIYFGEVVEGQHYINIDGQQRLMTLLSFINNELTLKMRGENGKPKSVNFGMLDESWQRKIKQYKPSIKICIGNEKSLLEWFKTINQPISELTKQELRNAAYNGEWCESIKSYFSAVKKTAKPNKKNADFLSKNGEYYYGNYSLNLQPERQDVLEMALDWASMQEFGVELPKDERIELYMGMYVDSDDNGKDLIERYKKVIDWAKKTFRKEFLEQKCAKNVEWGRLYAIYGNNDYDINDLNNKAEKYFYDEEVTGNSKVFEYVLMGCPTEKKNMLALRAFTTIDKTKMWKMQGGIDPIDGKQYKIDEMVAHHIVAWECGGKTEISNGVLVSKENHQKKIHAENTYTSNQIKEMRDKLIEKVRGEKAKA